MIKIENNVISKTGDSTIRTVTDYNPIPSSLVSTNHYISIGGGLVSLRLYGTWSFYVDDVKIVFNLDELQSFTKVGQIKTLHDTKNNYVMSLTLKNPILDLLHVVFDISLGIGASFKDIPKTSLSYPSYTVEYYNNLTHSHEIIGDINIEGDVNIENEIKTSSFHSTAPLMAKKNIFKIKAAYVGNAIGGAPVITFNYEEGLPILSSPDSDEYLLTVVVASNETIFVEPTSLDSSKHYRPASIPITMAWNNQIPMQTTSGVIQTDWYLILTKDGVTASTGFSEADFHTQTFTFTQYYLVASTINA